MSMVGLFFMVPVRLSNTVTFAYMAFNGIKSEYAATGDIEKSIFRSLHNAGYGVLSTGITMIVGVLLWIFADLRFHAEMGLLIALWLSVFVLAALCLTPALAYATRPHFIFDDGWDRKAPAEPRPATA